MIGRRLFFRTLLGAPVVAAVPAAETAGTRLDWQILEEPIKWTPIAAVP